MKSIFLSYRRDDEPGYVARLADSLALVFGNIVFRDVDGILGGSDWKLHLQRQVAQAQVVIVVIGQRWRSLLDENKPECDYVRFELNLARKLSIPIIPVLLRDARMTQRVALGNLEWLCDLQFLELSDVQERWATDLDHLADCIVTLTTIERLDPTEQSEIHDTQRVNRQSSTGSNSPNIQSNGGNINITFNAPGNKS